MRAAVARLEKLKGVPMSILKTLTWAVLITPLAFATVGCEKKDGPAEKAGEQVDEAAEEVSEGVEEAGDKIEDAVE